MDSLINKAVVAEEVFKLKRIVAQEIMDRGLLIESNRLGLSTIFDAVMGRIVRLTLDVATQEETIAETPVTWFDHLKKDITGSQWWKKYERFLPLRVHRALFFDTRWIVAVHKYPELTVPDSVLGREFVHLEVVDPWKLQDAQNKKGSKLS